MGNLISHRAVVGLKWARLAAKPPFGVPRGARGAKAAGLRYEKAFARALPEALHGKWIEYCDSNGPGYAQPDFILVGQSAGLVLETKYTQCEAGWSQPRDLYVPLCEAIWGIKFFPVQVCRALDGAVVRQDMKIYESIWQIVADIKGQRPSPKATLHWIGGEVGLRPPGRALPAPPLQRLSSAA